MALPSGGAGIAAPSGFEKPGFGFTNPVRNGIPNPTRPTGGVSYGPAKGKPVVPSPTFKMPRPSSVPGSGNQPPGASGTTSNPQATQPGLPDPTANLDATYYGNTGMYLFNTNNKIGALTQEQANNNVALQSALANIAYAEPLAQLKAMQAENARGGLYSSVEGQQQGQLVHAYNEQANTAESNAQLKNAGIAQQIAALQGSIPLYNQTQAIASSVRASRAAQNNPASSVPGGTSGSSSGAPGSSGGGSTTPVGSPSNPFTAEGRSIAASVAGKYGQRYFGGVTHSGPSTKAQPNPAVLALAKALAKGGITRSEGQDF